MQALQEKLAATNQKVMELETQRSTERERAASSEEHGRTVERQLAEEQQESARLAKKREDSEAELATQVVTCSSFFSVPLCAFLHLSLKSFVVDR